MSGIEPDSVSYWEDRTINIGSFESRKFGLSVTQKIVSINLKEQKVTISDRETLKVYPNKTIDETIDKAISTVRTRLDADEKELRTTVQEFVDDLLVLKGQKLFNIPPLEADLTNIEDDEFQTVTDDRPKKKRKVAKTFDGEDDDFETFETNPMPKSKKKKRRED